MILVEKTGMEIIPLELIFTMLVIVLSKAFIIFGGAVPYVFQYIEIYKQKDASGFSLLVCLVLCIANILRILFWFGKRFELPLLAQSVVILMTMALMLEISVRMNRRHVHKTQRVSVWTGQLISHFWAWNDLSSYFIVLIVFITFWSILTFVFIKYTLYVEGLGLVALLIEAALGVPQLVRNCQRRSTTGMSINMVLAWLAGDCGKTAYFIYGRSPAQFYICAVLQITIDVLILLQVYFFGKKTSRSRVQLPQIDD